MKKARTANAPRAAFERPRAAGWCAGFLWRLGRRASVSPIQLLLPIASMTLVVAAAALTTTANAQIASAHGLCPATEPAGGAALAAAPDRVSATFNHRLQTTFTTMTVARPAATGWPTREAAAHDARTLVLPLRPANGYPVNYRVTLADDHPASKSWLFQLTMRPTGTPRTSVTATDAADDTPAWPFVLGTVVAVAVAALWAVRRRP